MSDEEWRVIPSEPLYQASSFGRIYSTISHKVLAGAANKRGYVHVIFIGQRSREIHRVIAEAFLGTCPKGMQVRHMDGNAGNNAVNNLRYGTPSENMYDKGRHGTDHQLAKTHCPQGHPYNEVNTRYTTYKGRGGRACIACEKDRWQRRKTGPRDAPHGYVRYSTRKCRCEICKEGQLAYKRELQARRMAKVAGEGLPVSLKHGLNAYDRWGCRCDTCRGAKSAVHAARVARRAAVRT